MTEQFLVRAAEAEGGRLDGHGDHRAVMKAVKTAVVLMLHPESRRAGDPALVRTANEARAGSKEGVVRYVLGVGLGHDERHSVPTSFV